MIQNDMKQAERGTFKAAFDLGIWDILIATVASMFAVAPLLSVRMGDFWSSAVFVPVVLAVLVALRAVKRRVLLPRIGVVRLGSYRRARLRRLTIVLLSLNVVALVAGSYFALRFEALQGLLPVILFSGMLLVGFTLAASYLNIPRYFLYGLLLAAAPFAGEWLWRRGYAPHHGYPVVFGVAAVVIAAVGLIKLAVRLRAHAPSSDGPLAGENR